MSDYQVHSSYKRIEIAQLTATTNTEYNVSAAQSGSATLLKWAGIVSIVTDQTVTVRFNSTDNDPITLTAAASPLTINNLVVGKIFVTNASGSTANLKILLIGPAKVSL